MIKAHLILSQTRLIFSRLADFSSVLTEFNSIWSNFWSDSDPNPIQTRPAPRPGYIRNKNLKFHFTPKPAAKEFGSLTGRFPATPPATCSSSPAHCTSSDDPPLTRDSSNERISPPISPLLTDSFLSSNFDYFLNVVRLGGLVKAGLDVAQIWLDGDETLVNTIDRDGNMLPINMTNGHALTRDPLVVLYHIEPSADSEYIHIRIQQRNGRKSLTIVYERAQLRENSQRSEEGILLDPIDQRKNVSAFLTRVGIVKKDQIKIHELPI
ncbi:hypothetical protein LXL04_008734 [Taraxacum kok-saghyz]